VNIWACKVLIVKRPERAFNSLYESSSVCLLTVSDLVCFNTARFYYILPIIKQRVNYDLDISSIFPYAD
jgi:hypothetical protein